jgi:hypothetical protein
MRVALDETLDAMLATLRGERLSHDAESAILEDPRIQCLDLELQATIAAVCREHLTARLSTRELTQVHETLARYGVGTQQQSETVSTQTRYVIRLPQRQSGPAAGPVAVIDRPPLPASR